MSTPLGITRPDWAAVIAEHAVEESTAQRLIGQLVAVEVPDDPAVAPPRNSSGSRAATRMAR